MTQGLRASTVETAKALPLFWAGPLLRPWHLHWGATSDEMSSTMPGDELVHHAHLEATRAIAIAAPPEDVWPWIVQIGFRRAGFYSYDLIDNLGAPSADHVIPDLQDVKIGDWVAMAEPVNDTTAFRVAGFEPGRWLLWHKPDSTWAWRFDRMADGGTRLVTRLKQRYDLARPLPALGSMFLMEWGDFPMMRRLLYGVRARAEALAASEGHRVPRPADAATVSHWKDPDAREAYARSYAHAMGLWPTPYEHRDVPGPFGTTHVVVSGNPRGTPVLLVHAASLTATQWHLQAADLGADHRLYAVDIMGDIGLSTQTAPIHTRAEAAAWLASVIHGLGLDRVVVIGSSFGGFQATNLAVHHPDLVRALVLLAPAATLKPFRLLANAMIRTGSLVPLPMTVKPGLKGMMSGALPDPRIVQQMEIGVAGFRYDRAGIYPSEIPDTELAAIRCPTLVMVGDQEMIYDPVAAVDRVRRLIPDAQVDMVPDVGHLLGMQRPDIVNPRILGFLSSTSTRPRRRTRRARD
ncbi:MAG TPA: alpha/beta hydrolase [Candidatus Limnocylindrales bacterium]